MKTPSKCVRFGLFEFDLANRELRRDGVLVHLQSQPAQVLACLLNNAGQVVSREELHQAVWGGETFVNFEAGLNFCMSQLRAALGDNSSQPIYIRTIPKKGYQFLAPIERITSGALDGPDPAVPFYRRPIAVLAIAFIGLVLALSAVMWSRSQGRPQDPPIVAVVRFDNETGNPSRTLFSDALTDNVVEQLTTSSVGRYGVIGNAHILRVPRDQRDLMAIAASLHAKYVVLGQLQGEGQGSRLLAHLIRLPDQTHLWVVRVERPEGISSTAAADLAQQIAAQFSPRLAADSAPGASPLPALR